MIVVQGLPFDVVHIIFLMGVSSMLFSNFKAQGLRNIPIFSYGSIDVALPCIYRDKFPAIIDIILY